jgi:small subunit ribosomal protein S6
MKVASELRDYEVVYIIRPDLDEQRRKEKIERINQLIQERGGQVQNVDEWGTRIMAYEIDDFREGYYVLVNFTLPPSEVSSLEERLRVDDELLRYQIVRTDGD